MALDDTHQTSVYIPFRESDHPESYTLFPDRDLPNGYHLRIAAYNTAWSKCLQRIQELIHALHAPIVDRVAELVNKAYTDTLPGLPYAELPVISVTVFGTSSSIFDEISSRLETEGQNDLFGDDTGSHIVTHLFPQDCPNLTSAIKTLITGFINKTEEELDSVRRKPSGSLSTVDMSLLQLWFDALCDSRGSDSDTSRLVVILHDFERFDPLVVQDLFEISSLAIPRLPLVFILSLTSPPTPSYIHATYPRSTLARLQVRSCSFSTSQHVLHDTLLKTFFDIEFDPDLLIGPATIEFLVDFFGRHSPSFDGLVSILQLAHMKHFEEPLTVFLSENGPTSKDLVGPDSAPFLECLLARVQSSSLAADPSATWSARSVDELLVHVRTARTMFQQKSKQLRVSFQLFNVVQSFMVTVGHKRENTLPELMCAVLRGRFGTSFRYLCALIHKLQADQLDAFLSDLHGFFLTTAAEVQDETRSRIDSVRSALEKCGDEPRRVREIAEMVGNWLSSYFEHRFVSLDELPLWDIWYTGSAPFPSELINPSLRASIFSGLLHPQDYSATANTDDDEEDLSDMPDTSILFHRYLESGKMINVFDWFESFTVVLETQKERHAKGDELLTRTPTRRKGKERQRAEESEEEVERWRVEVQARFIRSLHELDYIGLIKHTGRKADHVVRTVFE